MPKAPHKQFAERLNLAWDTVGIPRDERRTGLVAERYDVSRESARKWGLGKSIPKDERLRAMAVQMNISYEWLSTGRGNMQGNHLSVREVPSEYDNPVVVRLNALIRKLSPRKQAALLKLLEEER